jgi:hypothetical protein
MAPDFVQKVTNGPINPDVGAGLKGPSIVEVLAHLPEHAGLEIRVRIAPINGTYEVTSLSMTSASGDDQPIPAEALRQLPLRTLVRQAVGANLLSLNIGQRITAVDGEDAKGAELRQVALAYRIARLVGDAPTKAVEKSLGVSRATAARRVAEAREEGALRADEIGQAGGAHSRLGD